jgi:ketosteroid isomerase-like protein
MDVEAKTTPVDVANAELVRHLYTEVSRGNPTPLIEHLADDVEWTIIGSTPLSGVFRGRDEVIGTLFAGLRARLAEPVRFTIERVIAAGGSVVFEARGQATSVDGRPYDNRYCIIVDVVDGKLARLIDYVDTELVRSALFPDAA